MPESARAAGLKQTVLKMSGSPEQCGALKPHDDIRQAGVGMSQYFLPMVAEARIRPERRIKTKPSKAAKAKRVEAKARAGAIKKNRAKPKLD